MPETPDFDKCDKQQIVSVLNKLYNTTLSVELIELAIARGFTSWNALSLDAQRPCECGCGRLSLGGMLEAAHPEDYRYERG
jgi:hypothetical protein